MKTQLGGLIIAIGLLADCGVSANPIEQPARSAAVVPAKPATIAPTATTSTAANAILQQVAGTYQFTEGPVADKNGNVYFADITAGKIYKWSPDGNVSVFVSGLNMPNGLAFDKNGNLIACKGGAGRLISIDPTGQITVLTDQYDGQRYNEPNDLWIDPQGGIYFTDPVYQRVKVQAGEDVYYLAPDRQRVTRVIDDLVRPNGIVGTADGESLYVADHGAGKTYVCTINVDGSLSNKKLFVSTGSDGMKLDASDNLYLTVPNQVEVFDANGNHLRDIPTQENPTNVAFAGKDGQTLFITARTAVYTMPLSTEQKSATTSSTASFTLTSPHVVGGGLLPMEYTCDGASSTLALAWSGGPAATKSYAVTMHHIASPMDIHWYWEVYDIPASVTSLPKNMTGIGVLGNNSVNGKLAYTPPCSKGPGPKEYIYTVYALSAEPRFTVPAAQVDRATLLDAIKDITLGSAELHVIYSRK